MTVTVPADPATEVATPTRRKRGKKPLVVVAVVLVLVAGAGLMVMKKRSAAAALEAGRDKPGAVVQLDPITLNLSDGHFLKLGLALQLSEAATLQSASGHGSTAAPVDGAKALDAAISVLGGMTYKQLLAPGGRDHAQRQLSKEVADRYDHSVLQVYFTEFLMQ